jgi:hypothetical protein
MIRAIYALVTFIVIGCGVEARRANTSDVAALAGHSEGRFAGCIDASLFSPQECDYTCEGGRMSGYLQAAADFCAEHGQHGDLACFCPN